MDSYIFMGSASRSFTSDSGSEVKGLQVALAKGSKYFDGYNQMSVFWISDSKVISKISSFRPLQPVSCTFEPDFKNKSIKLTDINVIRG